MSPAPHLSHAESPPCASYDDAEWEREGGGAGRGREGQGGGEGGGERGGERGRGHIFLYINFQ